MTHTRSTAHRAGVATGCILLTGGRSDPKAWSHPHSAQTALVVTLRRHSTERAPPPSDHARMACQLAASPPLRSLTPSPSPHGTSPHGAKPRGATGMARPCDSATPSQYQWLGVTRARCAEYSCCC